MSVTRLERTASKSQVISTKGRLTGELSHRDLLGHDEWWIDARKAPSGKHWIVWADDDKLKRLEKLKHQRNLHTAQRNPELTTPKTRKQ